MKLCLALALAAGLVLPFGPALAESEPIKTGGFHLTHTLVLPGTPEEIYDAATGDISGWWDHSVSGHPWKFYIEARPGGGFWEIFDESGDGVRHAVVTAAQRGKMLRFEGPLGLAGNAIHMVHTYTFEDAGEGKTRMTVEVNAAGQYNDGWPAVVDRVWKHFLFEQFQPYVEAGKHKNR